MGIFQGTILLALAMALQAAPPVKLPEIYAPSNDVKVDHHVAVRMRDSVILYADVYRPMKDGKYPILVSRTPYSTERAPSAYEEPLFLPGGDTSSSTRTSAAATSPRVSGNRSATTSRTDTTPWNGRLYSRGRTGKWGCRVIPTAVMCSGAPRWPSRLTW
jgi:hypothetical protein